MNAYIVILRLFEDNEEGKSTVKIVTVAPSLDAASDYAVKAYEKADGPMTEGFHWKAIHAEWIDGKVAIPSMKEVHPKA